MTQGQLFTEGIRLETREGACEIPWGALRSMCLGKIQPTRQVMTPVSPDAEEGLAAALGNDTPGVEKLHAFYVLDLYAGQEALPYRVDTVTSNLRKFLGAEAGYSGEINLLNLIRRIAEAGPQAVDASVQALLTRGKSAVPVYADLDAFGAASASVRPLGIAPAAAPASPSPQPIAVAASPPPPPRLSAGATVSSPEPGLGPMFLTMGHMVGLFFLFLAVWTTFIQQCEMPDGLVSWLAAGAFLTLAGLGTIKGRQGSIRPYLESNLWILRAWMLCAAVGFLVFGFCLGVICYGMVSAMSGAVASATTVRRGSLRLGVWLIGFLAAAAVGCVVFLGLGLNLLLLAAGTPAQLLDSPTLLDFIGIEV